ncbi:hypothetical protein [Actinoalloteichus hymeniacidonis]|uniref:Uncharacterized protein n=1 Tax=Actinoalloteichus hymeniacidonis TaxID=340345 RepID=A0AAC9HSV3_9PSEU|nr:hypothetical protein [Actinoalloteichus hymeniacidonis]AOS65052.1 hypothetical protein TL08_21325 [Actinoalloteichus hymeniacidonis]MBB5906869.1 putative membrane protein [Actinoalloteichus hymeniacidonis]
MVTKNSSILPALIRWQARTQLVWQLNFWILVVACIVLVSFLVGLFGTLDSSVADMVIPYSIKYGLACQGIGLIYYSLRSAVATGITRREFLTVAQLTAIALSLLLVIGTLLLGGIEQLVHDAMGIPTALSGVHLYGSLGQVHLVLIECLAIGLVHIAAGALIGTIALIQGPARRWFGILPAIGVVIGVEWALVHFGGGGSAEFAGVDQSALLWFVGIAVVGIALPWLAVRRLVRDIGIPGPESPIA